jgi:hypothetical protein
MATYVQITDDTGGVDASGVSSVLSVPTSQLESMRMTRHQWTSFVRKHTERL